MSISFPQKYFTFFKYSCYGALSPIFTCIRVKRAINEKVRCKGINKSATEPAAVSVCMPITGNDAYTYNFHAFAP